MFWLFSRQGTDTYVDYYLNPYLIVFVKSSLISSYTDLVQMLKFFSIFWLIVGFRVFSYGFSNAELGILADFLKLDTLATDF